MHVYKMQLRDGRSSVVFASLACMLLSGQQFRLMDIVCAASLP